MVHLGTMKALLSSLMGYGYFDVLAENGGGYVLTVDAAACRILQAEVFEV